MNKKTIYLVSCVREKLNDNLPHNAKDLYISPWFVGAKAYVEGKIKEGDSWFILSPKYFLANPEKEINAYEMTLNNMDIAERKAWAESTWESLKSELEGVDKVVFLAGERYREFFVDRIKAKGITVEIPMQGLRIGEQLQWLNKQI